jgi:hypothetical protein
MFHRVSYAYSDPLVARRECNHNSKQKFRHTPLHPREIRLMRLHPGRDGEVLHCSLFKTDIDAPAPYEAVSYVWGNPASTQDILLSHEVDTGHFSEPCHSSVGYNLYSALRRFRMPSAPVFLWADALCIDQHNVKEKEMQVPLMGEIYAKAERTLIWLGDDSRLVESTLCELRSAVRSDTLDLVRFSGDLCKILEAGFTELCSMPWWSRVWVQQELILARHAVFFAGGSSIGFRDLFVGFDCIESALKSTYRPLLSEGLDAQRRVALTLEFANTAATASRKGIFREHSKTLEELASFAVGLSCSDPRDRVFGLLGMVRKGGNGQPNVSEELCVDYKLTVREVYEVATRYMVAESRSLDIVLRQWVPKTDLKLPSWIQQYGSPYSSYGVSLAGSKSEYSASGHLPPKVAFMAKEWVDEAGRFAALVAEGIEVGMITNVSTRMADGLVSRDCLEMCGMVFDEEGGVSQTKSDWENTWRTLVADRDGRGSDLRFTTYGFSTEFYCLADDIKRLRGLDTDEMLTVALPTNIEEFLRRVYAVTKNRRVFHSAVNVYGKVLLGLAPRAARPGDTIALLFGMSVLVILRPETSAGKEYLKIVGEAYIHGRMEGEIILDLDDENMKKATRKFRLV